MVIRNTFEFMLWLFHLATDVVHLHSFSEDHLVSHRFCSVILFVCVFLFVCLCVFFVSYLCV